MALNHGYAAASTNTGHDGGDTTFALGHPEKLIDFGYRAVHEMTLKGKAITEAFYSKAPQRSYWNGCSSGGKQGLKEAQKFPLDYDGIVAGAPATSSMTVELTVCAGSRVDSISIGRVLRRRRIM